MAEFWITPEEVMAAAKWEASTLSRKARDGQIKWRNTKTRRRNGRPVREYLLTSLPSNVQLEIARRGTAIRQREETGEHKESAQLIRFRSELVQTDALRIVLPDPDAQAEAEHRLNAIGPLLDYLQWKTPAEKQLWCAQNDLNVKNSDDLARQIAVREGCATSTVWRWIKNYRTSGFASLADRIRADKGQSRWFARHREAAFLAAYLYLNERQSVTFVCEQIERDAEQLGIEADNLPSRETVRVFLSQEISPAMKALAREGQREYRERMAPYIRRGFVDVWANQIWVGDHMIHDVEVSNDLFDDAPFGSPVRLRLSAMLDYRSRKLVGATWCWEGSSRAIAATMRRAILQFGPPEGIYVDNGKDYIKVAKGARRGCESWLIESPLAPENWWQTEIDAIERTGFLARLGIAVTHCIPRHPQSKHVERFFRTLHTRFDSVHPTYTGGSPATRPDQTEAAMMLHRRLFKKGRVSESNHPLASRFILGCLSWIEEYNNTPHSGEGMDGRTPNEVFTAARNPHQEPAPEPQTLAMLMAEYEKRKVDSCAVTLNKRRYAPRPEDRLAWAAMHECNEREILVAYDPGDPECAAALTLDGHFIAWLEAEQLLRFAPGDEQTQQQIGQSMEIRRGLEKATKNTLRAIAATARSNGARTAEEMLYERLQLPATTAPVITQRKASLKPDKQAIAPPSATDIAANFLAGMKEKKVG